MNNYNKKLSSRHLLRNSRVGSSCPQCWEMMTPSNENIRSSATIEHIVRQKDGGTNSPSNLIIICKSCNIARGNTAENMQRKHIKGYKEWSRLSINNNCNYSKGLIEAYYSKFENEFWRLKETGY